MRNTSSIGGCAPEDLSQLSTSTSLTQTNVIKGATTSSTVAGLKPTLIDMSGLPGEYKAGVMMALKLTLKLSPSPSEHVVILCGAGIPLPDIRDSVTAAGYSPTTLPPHPTDEQVRDLRTWLRADGGILICRNMQFSGMEAPTCVFITDNLAEETAARSGLLRATARLVVVSYSTGLSMEKVREGFLEDHNSCAVFSSNPSSFKKILNIQNIKDFLFLFSFVLY